MMKALVLDAAMVGLILVGTAGAEFPPPIDQTLQIVPAAPSRPAGTLSAADAPLAAAARQATSSFSTEPTTGTHRVVQFSPPVTFPAPIASPTPAAVAQQTFVSSAAPAPAVVVPDPLPQTFATREIPAAAVHPAPVIESAPVAIVGGPTPGYAYRPLAPIVSTPKTLFVGRGLIGQPTVYVPGQPVRNFLRYLSP